MSKIYIEHNDLYYNKITWVLTLISQYTKVKYVFVDEKEQAELTIGSAVGADIQLDILFFIKLQNSITKWQLILPNGPIYLNENGNECLLETIFYLVNCIQETNLEKSDLDQWGRFKFTSSLQYHYGLIETNFVSKLIDRIIQQFPSLSNGIGKPSEPSEIFLSHDIDLIHSGWKIEGYLALKSFNIPSLIKVGYDLITGKPFYNNIDQVMDTDEKYGFKSCFYWLPASGKDENGIMNADYSVSEMNQMNKLVRSRGFENGIHKSSYSSDLKAEMSRFDQPVKHNRYHFLKFNTHEAWREIEAAGLHTDASLGFAEHIGFRNSYGLPFVPFDMEHDRPYSFVEIPLHVMDVTLFKYMNLGKTEIGLKLEDFVHKNRSNCVLSLLWHNNTMTCYHQDIHDIYSSALSRYHQENISAVLPDYLYRSYSNILLNQVNY